MSDLESQARQGYEKYKFSDMISQSIDVLSHPSVATFEKYEKGGTTQQAIIYVAVGAVIVGVLSLLGNLIWHSPGAAIGSMLGGIISTVLGFAVFSYLVLVIGRTQGGTGTQDEVFYSAGLFAVPLQTLSGVLSAIIALIPVLVCLTWPVYIVIVVYQAYLGYLMVRSSMNLDGQKAIITIVLSVLAMLFVTAIVGAIIGAIFVLA